MVRAALLILLLLLSACEPPPEPDPLSPRARQLYELRTVPSFAGLRDERGTLIAFVHDEVDVPAVTAIVSDVEVRTRPRRDRLPVTKSTVASDALSVDGAVMFDVDEVRNFLVYGLWKVEAIVPLQDRLVELGVPFDETIVKITPPVSLR